MDQLKPDVRAFLDEKRFAVLATVDADGSPQQSVMWYQIEEDHVMMNTASGRVKARNLRPAILILVLPLTDNGRGARVLAVPAVTEAVWLAP
jgi:predicted pyridoxine 5'-phosphate oxidase superfamily flavin-nucleotide-binding protein